MEDDAELVYCNSCGKATYDLVEVEQPLAGGTTLACPRCKSTDTVPSARRADLPDSTGNYPAGLLE